MAKYNYITVVQNLANIVGVFKGRYTMHGPFKTPEEADTFAKGHKDSIWVKANQMLYIPKKEYTNVILASKPDGQTTRAGETKLHDGANNKVELEANPMGAYAEVKPKPKPSQEKPASKWLD
jgi:hypothetical protein